MCGKRRTVGGKFKVARSTKVFVGRAHFVQIDKVKIPNFMQFSKKSVYFPTQRNGVDGNLVCQ